MNVKEYVVNLKSEKQQLEFRATSHDDLFSIVERAQRRTGLAKDDAACLGIGLKLLANVVVKNRNDPFYSDIYAAIGAFIKKLKNE